MNNTGISPKVANGFGAAGGSTPISIIVIWLIGLLHVTVPPEVAAAIASLLAAVASGVAGYWTSHDPTTVAALAAFQGASSAPMPKQGVG